MLRRIGFASWLGRAGSSSQPFGCCCTRLATLRPRPRPPSRTLDRASGSLWETPLRPSFLGVLLLPLLALLVLAHPEKVLVQDKDLGLRGGGARLLCGRGADGYGWREQGRLGLRREGRDGRGAGPEEGEGRAGGPASCVLFLVFVRVLLLGIVGRRGLFSFLLLFVFLLDLVNLGLRDR